MRLLILFVVLIAAGTFVLSERNHCYWHGFDRSLEWVTCLDR
jgi:hypothetical protein